ncbi:FkbM family methyltransferase [Pseudomonas sp. RIT-PI-AD]|uniref:FkbM family methyltransferase n=1 Tax=Pseudomonas sp. RIT-PI-AD TaxID=3035294 RepID=UPI0021D867BB|nr:FkbM family methyltransferase [Pseudomonas sp. RIT-PI-AD]
MIKREISIGDTRYLLEGDEDYLGRMPEDFESDTVRLIEALVDPARPNVDVGANIGLTSLLIARLAPLRTLIAIEPVPAAYACLEHNLARENVELLNVAAGRERGSVSMYVDQRNLATSFIADVGTDGAYAIPVMTLDEILGERDVGFVKIDVEGFELEVLAGAHATLERCRPLVMLEMNHWCLNVFRRIALPDFHERLLDIFPVLYALEQGEAVEFTRENAGRIFEAHILGGMKYMNLVGGYDRADLEDRLSRYRAAHRQ